MPTYLQRTLRSRLEKLLSSKPKPLIQKSDMLGNFAISMVATAAALVIGIASAYAAFKWQKESQDSTAFLQEAGGVAEQATQLSFRALDLMVEYRDHSRDDHGDELNAYFSEVFLPNVKTLKREMLMMYFPLRRYFGPDIAKVFIRVEDAESIEQPRALFGLVATYAALVTVNRQLHEIERATSACGIPCEPWSMHDPVKYAQSNEWVQKSIPDFENRIVNLMTAFDERLTALGARNANFVLASQTPRETP